MGTNDTQQEMQRDFKGVWIPKEVWLDRRLTALDKIILTEIDSLDRGERGCYASNKYIAEFCQCSETKVSKSISMLIEYGYLYVQAFDGRQRELRSRLSNFAMQACKNDKAEMQKVQESNTENKTVNNKDNNNILSEIVDFLNSQAGTRFRPTSADTKKHINARLTEGFTVDDFKAVITKKCAEWRGSDMEQYLRPSTLFGTKFESYLNAKQAARRTPANAAETVNINGKDYIKKGGKYYLVGGSNVAVDPFQTDDLPF